MKKLIISLVVVALTSLGLVATSLPAANATTCPYSGCVGTKTTLGHPRTVKRGGYVNFKVAVQPRSGTAQPHGRVTLRCTGPGTTHVKSRSYNGHRLNITMRFGKRGAWHCTARFSAASKWRTSSAAGTIHVVRR